MNEREVLTVFHVCSMVHPHSFWSLVKVSMYVVYYVVRCTGGAIHLHVYTHALIQERH